MPLVAEAGYLFCWRRWQFLFDRFNFILQSLDSLGNLHGIRVDVFENSQVGIFG